MNWYALYVNSRAEKKVAESLSAQGFEVFCPLEIVIKQWSDRKKKVAQPFFRSYVFARFDLEERLAVLQTPGVVNIVYWLKQPAVIRDGEMQAIIDFFEENKTRGIVTESIAVGQQREITRGLLKNRVGTVIKNNRTKVVLAVKELGLIFTVDVAQTALVERTGQKNT